jgi:hypothetical protein
VIFFFFKTVHITGKLIAERDLNGKLSYIMLYVNNKKIGSNKLKSWLDVHTRFPYPVKLVSRLWLTLIFNNMSKTIGFFYKAKKNPKGRPLP